MPVPLSPPGVSWCLITLGVHDFGGGNVGGTLVVEPETPVRWALTNDLLLAVTIRKAITAGGIKPLYLPHTDQSGFVNSDGTPIVNFGYRFSIEPVRAARLSSNATITTLLPMSKGPTVSVGSLVDIGAWPNSGGVINPPVVNGNVTYTETFPGSGAYIVTVS